MTAFASRYGPWAVVAGASEGIGAAFARQLARRGLDLVLLARRTEPLADLADELTSRHGVGIRQVALDLASPALASEIKRSTRDIDVGLVIYNAALSVIQPFMEQSLEQHLASIDVNCRGPVVLARLFGRRMMQRGRGGLVLMSSLAGFQGSPLISAYAASRAFNLVLAEGLADELRQHGVDVLVCCAGATRTPGYERSRPEDAGWLSVRPMEPDAVATEALGALGRRSMLIAGRQNRLASLLLHRLLPRRLAVRIMGRATRAMYPDA